MKKLLLAVFPVLLSTGNADAQGCVAIRSNGGYCSRTHSAHQTDWNLSINNRYFKSFRHFVGTVEQKQRIEQGTQVINHSWATNFFLTRNLKNGWSLGLDIPVIANDRSSLYEHGGRSRHVTSSFGLGDIRFVINKWLTDPAKMNKFNVQAGLGLKLPTGDFRFQDKFYVNDSTTILGPVDQSIQLGDGGTGLSLELNATYQFNSKLSAYGYVYYLANPREQNGVSTARGATPSVASQRYKSDVMSVPDQYMWRAGFNYQVKQFTFSAGARHECIPVHDLIGGSGGFRRPGYVISAEPGITWEGKKVSWFTYVPFSLVRSRTQSVPDKIRTQITGVYAQGDAAFADYTINLGLRFGL